MRIAVLSLLAPCAWAAVQWMCAGYQNNISIVATNSVAAPPLATWATLSPLSPFMNITAVVYGAYPPPQVSCCHCCLFMPNAQI